jgi:LytS/YehU family sensor histidine kinase
MNAFGYGTWAVILTPLVLLLCAKIPLARRRWPKLACAHVLAIAGIVCVDVSIKTLWGSGVFPSMSHRPFAQQFRRVFFSEAEPDIQIYLVVAVIGYVVAYYAELRSQERHQAELETELVRADLHILRTQLQPHFLFNALHSIAALLQTDPRAAQRMICSLGDLLRASLAGWDLPETTLGSELELLKLYLDIQKVRFQEQLVVEVRVPSDVLDAKVPHFLLQPLAENAIKYGVTTQPGPRKIEVFACREFDTACIRVTNDLQVLVAAPEPEGLGIGLANLRHRLRILYGDNGRLSTSMLSDGRFEVEVRVPLQRQAASCQETYSESSLPLASTWG